VWIVGASFGARSARRAWLVAICTAFACGKSPGSSSLAATSTRGADASVRGRDAGKAAAGAATTATGRDAGSNFGFAAFAVDAAAASSRGSEVVRSVPDGWTCRPGLALDDVCDCGCGAGDSACDSAGCGVPGCSLPSCGACFATDGTSRDCGAPGAWLCERERRGDGVCDCGCGAIDPDCPANGGCYQPGCNVRGCEQCHGPKGSAACDAPPAFRCRKAVLGDGACDCGCGNYDPDCKHSSCVEASCYATGCEVCHDQAGRVIACAAPPSQWTCDAALRGDGACDCGCGQADPDCPANGGCVEPGCAAEACRSCHDGFGRELACPGLFTCGPARFGDGRRCDCGCGRADPDCGGGGCEEAGCDADGCDVRHDATGKALAPAGYVCAASSYGAQDGCDCGCGAIDPDCAKGCAEPGCREPSCDHCRLADGSAFDCRFACELSHYGTHDGCDCGCGAFDPDCGGLGCYEAGCFAGTCTRCFDSSVASYTCARGACASGYESNGVCDCGCRSSDPDCIDANACVEPGCSADGCGVCHSAQGARTSCSDWTCGLEQQGGGDGCNCGCGAPDPDCASGEGCAEPGCLAEGCITCRSVLGAPMSCAP